MIRGGVPERCSWLVPLRQRLGHRDMIIVEWCIVGTCNLRLGYFLIEKHQLWSVFSVFCIIELGKIIGYRQGLRLHHNKIKSKININICQDEWLNSGERMDCKLFMKVILLMIFSLYITPVSMDVTSYFIKWQPTLSTHICTSMRKGLYRKKLTSIAWSSKLFKITSKASRLNWPPRRKHHMSPGKEKKYS